MRKFKWMLALLLVGGMYACNGGTAEGTETTTPADTTQTQVEDDHSGHDHGDGEHNH